MLFFVPNLKCASRNIDHNNIMYRHAIRRACKLLMTGPIPVGDLCKIIAEYARELTFGLPDIRITKVVVLPDGRLVSASYEGYIHVWDRLFKEPRLLMEDQLPSPSFALTSTYLVIAPADGFARIFNFDLVETKRASQHMGGTTSVAVQNKTVITGSFGSSMVTWDPWSDISRVSLDEEISYICSLINLPDGRIAAGTNKGPIRIYDKPFVISRTLIGHIANVYELAIFQGNLVSGSNDGSIRIWDICSCTCLQVLEGHTKSITGLIGTDVLISCSFDGTLRSWVGGKSTIIADRRSAIYSIAALPDGRILECRDRVIVY